MTLLPWKCGQNMPPEDVFLAKKGGAAAHVTRQQRTQLWMSEVLISKVHRIRNHGSFQLGSFKEIAEFCTIWSCTFSLESQCRADAWVQEKFLVQPPWNYISVCVQSYQIVSLEFSFQSLRGSRVLLRIHIWGEISPPAAFHGSVSHTAADLWGPI